MSEEKLDLILNVVSEIKSKQDKLEIRFDGLETEFIGLNQKVDNLTVELKDFKTEVAKSLVTIHNRFGLIEKQMMAIGIEVKEEIKVEIRAVNRNIERLEKQILIYRDDSLDIREKVHQIEERLSQLEHQISAVN